MEIRGRQYKAAQGTGLASSTPEKIVDKVAGKTLYINYILVTNSDFSGGTTIKVTDGSGGSAIYFEETGTGVQRAISINFGVYGYALTKGNALYAETSNANQAATVTALGYYK